MLDLLEGKIVARACTRKKETNKKALLDHSKSSWKILHKTLLLESLPSFCFHKFSSHLKQHNQSFHRFIERATVSTNKVLIFLSLTKRCLTITSSVAEAGYIHHKHRG